MPKPTLTVHCADPDCLWHDYEDVVQAMVENGKTICLNEDDERCPECGKAREMIR